MSATILIVDDDNDVRDSLAALLAAMGFAVQGFTSAIEFLEHYREGMGDCLVADVRMPGMDGLELQRELMRRGIGLPVIIVTGHGDIPLAVKAMKAGAIDFIKKPFDETVLLDSIKRGLALVKDRGTKDSQARAAGARIAALTAREREVLEKLVLGRPNKIIAFELDISPRTVEIHRAHLMEKMQARSLSDLVRMALAAGLGSQPE